MKSFLVLFFKKERACLLPYGPRDEEAIHALGGGGAQPALGGAGQRGVEGGRGQGEGGQRGSELGGAFFGLQGADGVDQAATGAEHGGGGGVPSQVFTYTATGAEGSDFPITLPAALRRG